MAKKLRPPAEIIESMSVRASVVRNAANALSDRIRLFEQYLANLPGRVEAEVYGNHPDDDESGLLSLALKLHRQGKDWVISLATHHPSMDHEPGQGIEWKTIHEAPLKLKMAAVDIFPYLLESILQSQDKLADDLLKAAAKYDEFAKALPRQTAGSTLPQQVVHPAWNPQQDPLQKALTSLISRGKSQGEGK